MWAQRYFFVKEKNNIENVHGVKIPKTQWSGYSEAMMTRVGSVKQQEKKTSIGGHKI